MFNRKFTIAIIICSIFTAVAIYFAKIPITVTLDEKTAQEIEQTGKTPFEIGMFYSNADRNINSSEAVKKDEVKEFFRDYSPLINQLNQYIKGKTGEFGIYFMSLKTGQEFGINEDDRFVAASTVKVPINLYLYSKIADGSVDPEMKLTYMQEDYEEGTGIIQNEKLGKQYSIRELSRLSIEESDNIAINMIIRYLGREKIYTFMSGIQGYKIDTGHNLSSPKEMALYLKAVLDFSLEHNNEGGELIKYLQNTVFNDRIPKYLPKGISVAHKIGTQIGTVNDVGVIFAENPYIISIMTKDVNEDEAVEAIANISKIIYDFQEK